MPGSLARRLGRRNKSGVLADGPQGCLPAGFKRVLTIGRLSHRMLEVTPFGDDDRRAMHMAHAAQEDDVLNCNIIKFNTALCRGPLGGSAAWEECARRSEVHQH